MKLVARELTTPTEKSENEQAGDKIEGIIW